MTDNDHQGEFNVYSRRDFTRFFIAKYYRLLQAALRRSESRPDYTNPDVISAIMDGYKGLDRVPEPPQSIVPKHIFMLWQQGWDKAPDLVHACANSWRHHNPDWQLHLLDDTNLGEFAPDYEPVSSLRAGRPARSNLARLSLLANNGGIWADATLFCTRPLDQWLPVTSEADTFMFSKPRPYRYVDIWFMAASAENKTIEGLRNISAQYWQNFSRPHHYYWMEYLYELLVARQPDISSAWQHMTKLSALGPLSVGGNPFDTGAPKQMFEMIERNVVPAHKLSHKWKHTKSLKGTPLGALTGLERL